MPSASSSAGHTTWVPSRPVPPIDCAWSVPGMGMFSSPAMRTELRTLRRARSSCAGGSPVVRPPCLRLRARVLRWECSPGAGCSLPERGGVGGPCVPPGRNPGDPAVAVVSGEAVDAHAAADPLRPGPAPLARCFGEASGAVSQSVQDHGVPRAARPVVVAGLPRLRRGKVMSGACHGTPSVATSADSGAHGGLERLHRRCEERAAQPTH